MMNKTDKWKWAYVGMFVLLMVFFIKITPLVVFDADDWMYISYTRMPVPIWGHWNPSRVFPEVVMPFVSSLAAWILYPLTGNYMGSLTFMFALSVSLTIVVYVYIVSKWLRQKMEISERMAAGISFLFLILHFLIFKVGDYENLYLFHASDVTCYFNYTIPVLLNLVLIAVLDMHPEWRDLTNGKFHYRKAFVILATYLMVYSHLYCSYLIALWCGMHVILQIKRPFSIRTLVQKNVYEFVVMVAWLIALVLETSGGRAQDFSDDSMMQKLWNSVSSWVQIRYNTVFLWFVLICLVLAAVLFYRHRKEKQTRRLGNLLGFMLVCGILSLVYLILLSAVTTPSYTGRPEIILGAYEWFLGFLCILTVYILQKMPSLRLLVPVALFILFFELNGYGRMYKANAYPYVNVYTIADIGNDMIQQFVDATEKGEDCLELHIPDLGGKWPLPDYNMGERISHTLYKHRVIDYEIDTVVVLDDTFNTKYRIQYEDGQ